jgi:hypothetical protein
MAANARMICKLNGKNLEGSGRDILTMHDSGIYAGGHENHAKSEPGLLPSGG